LYIDSGESGLTLDRPAFNRLMTDVESGKVKTMIVTSSDRIARSGDLLMEWIFHFKHTGAQCLSLDAGGKDIRTESDFLTYMMFSFYLELATWSVPGLNFQLKNKGVD
jgi:DNA invertase Pin-like site-specific DNA recombinase